MRSFLLGLAVLFLTNGQSYAFGRNQCRAPRQPRQVRCQTQTVCQTRTVCQQVQAMPQFRTPVRDVAYSVAGRICNGVRCGR